MTADLATLSLAIDSRPANDAAVALDRLTASSGTTERATQRVLSATDALVAALMANTRAVTAATAGYAQMGTQVGATATGLDQFVTRNTRVVTAMNDQARAVRSAADGWKALSEMGRAALLNIEASNKLGSLSSNGGVMQRPGAASPPGAAQENRLSAFQIQNLAYQSTDIVASAASGMSPLTIALQQGGQIIPMFAGPGSVSVKGALAQAGEAATSMAARIGLVGGALGATAAVVATGAAAWMSYVSAQKEVEQQLQGIGRASGATVGQINAIASASAGGAGVSRAFARSAAGEFASTGRIGPDIYGQLIGSVRDYAATVGTDVSEANTALAQAFADPAKGADTLNKQLGMLNATTLETITRLSASGDRLGAQRVLLDSLSGSLVKASDRLGFFAREWEKFRNATSNEFDAIGSFIDRGMGGGDVEARLANAQRILEASQSRQGGIFGSILPGTAADDVAKAQADVTRLQGELAKQRQASAQTLANQRSIEIAEVVKSLNPERQQLKDMQDQAEKLRKAISDPMEFGLSASKLADTNVAFGNLSRAVQSLTSDIEQFGSRAVAALNRTAEFNNRTATFAPAARSAAQIMQDADERERSADSREIAGIRRARDLDLDTLRRQTMQTPGTYRTNLRDVPEQYRDRVYNAAIAQGINPNLLSTVFEQESRFRPEVISGQRRSSAGAIGPFQFMPGTAAEYRIDPTNFDQSANAAALYLRRALDRRNGDEALALADYNAGPGRVNAAGGDVTRLPRETRDYIARALQRTPDTGDMVNTLRDQNREVQNQQRLLGINTELYGKNGQALDAQTRAQQMLQDAQARGIEITDGYRAQILQVTQGMSGAAQTLAMVRFSSDVGFERDQLGRDRITAGAYARARGVVGDTSSPAAQEIIDQTREIGMLSEARGTLTDAASGFATDLRRSGDAASSLANSLGRVADRLLNSGVDSLIGAGFKAFSSGGGGASGGGFLGMLGSLFGGGGGSAAAASAAPQMIGSTLWFANGGIMTGRGTVPLRTYATGGIADSPQAAIFGEGSTPEAYVPLPDGRSIPVTMQAPANMNAVPMAQAPTVNNFDLRGSTLTMGEVQTALRGAIAANNAEQRRTAAENDFVDRRAFR